MKFKPKFESEDMKIIMSNIESGIRGPKGDTPQKGIDYFTEADKEELIIAVLNRVIDASEVKY